MPTMTLEELLKELKKMNRGDEKNFELDHIPTEAELVDLVTETSIATRMPMHLSTRQSSVTARCF
jgi:hypothetical protein